MTPPTLTTDRLTLRALVYADFPAYAAFLATDRAQYMGGPLTVDGAWNYFCNDTAQWIHQDMGGLMIDTADGQTIGQVSVCHGPVFPEPELGWFLYDGAEGHGYAFEAASAMKDWAMGPRGLTTLVSYIDDANLRSRALAERLGGEIDPTAATPNNDDALVYRYARAA